MTKRALTLPKLQQMKQAGEPLAVLTAYDYPSAQLAESAGVDMILVGDSLGNVVLGYDTTIPVTLEDMIYHTRAVARGARHTFLIADMPFLTYHTGIAETLRNAARLMQEGHAHAVKLEGGAEIADEVRALVRAGIPVVGHIGLTPQAVHQLGGYRVQGKTEEDAARLMNDALALADAGACSIVLELVVEPVAAAITAAVSVPTIGIGAGRGCDGQVLVYHDVLQYTAHYQPKKFVKTYMEAGKQMHLALSAYVQDVKSRAFPEEGHSFAPVQPVQQAVQQGSVQQGSMQLPAPQAQMQHGASQQGRGQQMSARPDEPQASGETEQSLYGALQPAVQGGDSK